MERALLKSIKAYFDFLATLLCDNSSKQSFPTDGYRSTSSEAEYELMNDGIAKSNPIPGITTVATVTHIMMRKYFRVFSVEIRIASSF